MNTRRIGAVIQARLGSTRLTNKVLADICGKTALQRVIERTRQIDGIDTVIVAHPVGETEIGNVCADLSCDTFEGSGLDVLDRYYRAAKAHGLDIIMRITADCPLLDPKVSTQVLQTYSRGSWDYVSNCHPNTFPNGLDTEVISFWALERMHKLAKEPIQREHVTPYAWERPSPFNIQNVWCSEGRDFSKLRWTLDEQRDLDFIRTVHEHFGEQNFGMAEMLEWEGSYANLER